MMEHNHGNNAGCLEAVQQVAVTIQFRLVERGIRTGLQT